jgi:hypothetical protein
MTVHDLIGSAFNAFGVRCHVCLWRAWRLKCRLIKAAKSGALEDTANWSEPYPEDPEEIKKRLEREFSGGE